MKLEVDTPSVVTGDDVDKVLTIAKERANFVSLVLKRTDASNGNPDYSYEIPIRNGVCIDSIFIENGSYEAIINDGGMMISQDEIFHFFYSEKFLLVISKDTSIVYEMRQNFSIPGAIRFVGLDSMSGDLGKEILEQRIAFSCPSSPCVLGGKTNLIEFLPVKKNFTFTLLGQKYSGYFDITTMKKGVVDVPVTKLE
jgi:hypothetical protein